MKFDRKQFILGMNKVLAYLINTVLVVGILGLIGLFVYGLYLAATG